jgi:hypothetical protein
MAASTSRLELVDVATAEMAARGQRWKPGHAALRVLLKQAYECSIKQVACGNSSQSTTIPTLGVFIYTRVQRTILMLADRSGARPLSSFAVSEIISEYSRSLRCSRTDRPP